MNSKNFLNVLKKGSIIGKDTCDDKRYKKDLTDLIRSSKVESEYCAVHEIVFRDIVDEKGKKRKDKKEFLFSLVGQKDTLYEDSIMTFIVSVKGKQYPWEGPNVKVVSLFFHPNIKGQDICLDILKGEWKPSMSFSSLAQSLVSFLIVPNEKDPLNGIVNQIYIKKYDKYEKYARYIAKKYMNKECYEIIKKDFINGTNEYEKLLPFSPLYESVNGEELTNYNVLIKIMDKIINKSP
jgi:ubiquitin-protein ligase